MAQTIKLKRSATQGAAPTTSNLALGEVAINTYDGKMYIKKDVGGTESIVEIGGNLQNSVSYLEAGMVEYEYTATSNQTTFSGSDSNGATLSYTANSIMVFLNGVLQDDGVDYTATNGTSVVFGTGLVANDEVRIIAINTVATTSNLSDPTKLDAITTVNAQAAYSLTLNSSAYTPSSQNALIVSLNGITQEPGDSFTISGSTITFSPALVTGDVVDYIVDMGRAVTIGEYSGDLAVGGELEVTGDIIGDLRGATLFKAQAGESLAKGDVVYISGISGNTTVVSKADADDAAKMPAFGLVAAAASSGTPVDIYTFGELSGLDTSSFSEGDELYVSTTAGTLTNSAPTGESSKLQKIAKVTRSDNSAGSVFIMGAGRSNAVPNLDDGDIFIGNASNQAVTATLDTSIVPENGNLYHTTERVQDVTGGQFVTNGTHTGISFTYDDAVDGAIDATVSLTSFDTDNLSEGSTNLYYTDARVDSRLASGSVGNIVTTGYIAGPSTFTIDPAAVGDNTGTLVIAGNLQVDGTTTTINSTTMTVDDLNITLASGAANAAAANGAGITVDGASATLTYNGTNDDWNFNKGLNVTGNFTSTGIDDNAASTAITIDSSQEVGIGVTAPQAPFHARKSTAVAGELEVGRFETFLTGVTNGQQILKILEDNRSGGSLSPYSRLESVFISSDGSTLDAGFEFGGNSAGSYLTIDSSGNLSVAGATNLDSKLTITNANYDNHIELNRSSEQWRFSPSTDGSLDIRRVSGTGAETVDFYNNVTVNGNIKLDEATDSNYDVFMAAYYDYDGWFRLTDGGGVVRFSVGRDNHAYVGGAGTAGNKLWDEGDFNSTTVNNWNTAYAWGDHAQAGYTSTTGPFYHYSSLSSAAPGTSQTARFGRSSSQYMTFHGSSAGNVLTSVSSTSNPKSNMYFAISQDDGSTSGQVFTLNGSSGTIWHTGNDGSGSGLDADLWDGNQFSSYLNQAVLTTSDVTHAQIIATNWLRATGERGLYSESYGQHFYPDADGFYWDCDGPIRHRDGYEGTIKMYSGYHNADGQGILSNGGSWWLNMGTLASDGSHIIIGGHTGNNAYNSVTTRRLMIGGGDTDARDNYYIGTNLENKGGNYNKLDLRWHTGIRIGAQAQYGGVRIFDSEDVGTTRLSISNSVDHSGAGVRAGPWAGSQTGQDAAFEVRNNGGTGDADLANINFHCANQYGTSLHLRADSYFGVGGWSASTWRWYVQLSTGNMTAAGNVTAYSDPRLKENITPLTGAIDKIKKLNGMEFTWKDLPHVVGTPGSRDYGVLSTEVAEVAPHAVHESPHTAPDGDTYKTVAYDKLIPLLIEGMKEQQKLIEELQEKLL